MTYSELRFSFEDEDHYTDNVTISVDGEVYFEGGGNNLFQVSLAGLADLVRRGEAFVASMEPLESAANVVPINE